MGMERERMNLKGVYHATLRAWADGPILWEDDFDNVVATVGKNALFNAGLVTSAVTLVGPYMGLISSVSFTAVAAADTMASHGGWLEAGAVNAPAYTYLASTVRGSPVFGTPSAGSTSITALTFAFTNTGTVQGAFMVFASGAVNTQGNTGGTLLSAGTFGTSQGVVNGNTLTVSYSISM